MKQNTELIFGERRQKTQQNKTMRQSSKKKKELKNEKSLRNMLDNMKHNNIHIMGIPERKESEQGIETTFEEIQTQNFSNPGKGKSCTSPGSSECPKQVGPKEAYTEI